MPHQMLATELEDFGKLERDGRVLHRLRLADQAGKMIWSDFIFAE